MRTTAALSMCMSCVHHFVVLRALCRDDFFSRWLSLYIALSLSLSLCLSLHAHVCECFVVLAQRGHLNAGLLTPPPGSTPSASFIEWYNSLTPDSMILLDDPNVKRHLPDRE